VEKLNIATGDLEVEFAHFDLQHVLAELLVSESADKSQFSIDFGYHRTIAAGERVYDELHSGNWWREKQAFVRAVDTNSSVLSLILYVDGVLVDFFGKISMIPIMISVGNFSQSYRQTLASKRLFGFIPSLSEEQIRSQTRKNVSVVRREILQGVFSK